jgi:hypothetical protein
LVVGTTGPFGSSARSLSLMFDADDPGVCAGPGGAGLAVGGIANGREGAAFCWPAPATGPGEPRPLGPGLGAVPGVFETAVAVVGLGFGTPDFGAGGSDAWAAGAGEAMGAELACTATAAAVGEALGATGAGVAGFAVGAAVGAGGLGEGAALARAVGAGDGCWVGGALTATAIGATVGIVTGAAGSAVAGAGSKTFCVGCGAG